MTTTEQAPQQFEQPDRRKHPDGIHRDWWSRPIYITPGEPGAATKCGWVDETGHHGCGEHVQGRPYQRMTTFIGVLEDTFRIEKWAKRNVLIGLVVAEHLVLKAAGQIDPDDPHRNKDELDKIAEEAEGFAKAHAGSDSGTALHAITERLDRGEKAQIPAANKADVAAYYAMLDKHQLKVDRIEVAVVIDGVNPTKTAPGIGGRYDRIVRMPLPCPTCGNYRRVADLKTQKSMEWGANKTAMQLAGYAMGMEYDPATGNRIPQDVCQCIGYVLHVPVGKGEATLYRAQLAPARELLKAAYAVWQARQMPDLLDEAITPELPDVFGLIAAAGDRAGLESLHASLVADGLWNDQHAEAAWRRLQELEGS